MAPYIGLRSVTPKLRALVQYQFTNTGYAGFRAAHSYRGYVGDSGGLPFSCNVAQFSLAWTPSAGHLIQ